MSHAVITPESVVSVGVRLPPDLGLIFAHLRPRTRTALIPTDNREPGPERLYAVLLHEYFTEWRPWRWPRIGDRFYLYIYPATGPNDALCRICNCETTPSMPWGRDIRPGCFMWTAPAEDLVQTFRRLLTER